MEDFPPRPDVGCAAADLPFRIADDIAASCSPNRSIFPAAQITE